jgi:hypothetical protein
MALATNPPASPFGLLAVYFPPLVPLTFGVVAQQKKGRDGLIWTHKTNIRSERKKGADNNKENTNAPTQRHTHKKREVLEDCLCMCVWLGLVRNKKVLVHVCHSVMALLYDRREVQRRHLCLYKRWGRVWPSSDRIFKKANDWTAWNNLFVWSCSLYRLISTGGENWL